MDISKIAGAIDGEKRAKIDSLRQSDAAKALENMFSEAELIAAASGGDEAAVKGILRRVLATEEGRQLAKMLGEAMK